MLFRQAVHAAGGRGIDPAAEQENTLVGAAGRGQVVLDRYRLAHQCEPGFLPRFADRDRRLRLSAVDETGGRLELPRRAAGEQRRETELLDKHDALPVGVVEHDRSRLPAAQCVVIAQGTPPAGKQAMPERKTSTRRNRSKAFVASTISTSGCAGSLPLTP